MENLFSMWKVRELADKVTNVVMNYTEIEAKVREATNDEPWGPTGQIMQDLAHSTFTYEHFPEVMSMLWKRMLQDNKQHWRRTYKSLLVLHYLIKNGSERVVTSAREHIYDLRSLENYTFIDDVGKDQGVNIRHKVKEMIDFIQDDDRLREERKKAKKNKDKFIGMSSDMMSMRFGGSRDTSWEDRSYGSGAKEREWEDGGATNRYRDHRNDAGSYDEEYEPEDDSDDGEATNNKTSKSTTSPTHGMDKQSNSPVVFEKKVNLNLSTNAVVSSPSKKQNRVLKKVDLGAAAHFGRGATSQHSSLPAQTSHRSDDLLSTSGVSEAPSGDILDFDPRADSVNVVTVTSQPDQATEFGDFDTAFGPLASSKQPTNDSDFADFTGAFSVTHTASNAPLVGSPVSPIGQMVPQQTASHIANNNITMDFPIGLNPDGLYSEWCDPTSKKHHPARKKDRKQSRNEELRRTLNATTEKFETVRKITCQKEAEDVLGCVQDILEEIFDLDESLEGAFDAFINTLLMLFDERFPSPSGKQYELIKRLFSIEDPTCFSVSYRCLMRHLNGDTVAFLELILQTEAFFGYTYKMSMQNKNQLIATALEDEWLRYVTLLVSTPNRVANALKGKLPDFFMVENFSNFIFSSILQLIECLSESIFKNRLTSDRIRYESISLLLSKVLLNLYQENAFEGAKCLVNILALITNHANPKMKEYRQVIQNIVSRLERTAIEIFAKIVLSHLDPRKYKIEPIFGEVITSDAQWKYTVCTKIPMLTYHGYHHDNLIVNLCSYLSVVSAEALAKMLFELSHTWADKFAMSKSSVEERLYFAKLMVCALKTLPTSSSNFETLQKNIMASVPMHLESTVTENRLLGMKLAEIFLNHFNSAAAKHQLKFDYEGVGEESLKILEELEYMADKKFDTQPETVNEVQEEVEKLFQKLQCPNKKVYECIPDVRSKTRSPIVEKEVAETKKDSNIRILDPSDFDLDSDDDLQPYNTPDDTKERQTPPSYLRDLKEALLETQSAEKFEVALRHCEAIVASQLPDDDVALGVELLEILVSLEPRFYMEQFETLVLKSCVAVMCVYPKKYAEYICRQIHADLGAYSISKRIFLLDVLVGSAKRLSDGSLMDGKNERTGGGGCVDDIIRDRLERKTRYFSRYRSSRRANLNRFAEVAAHYFFPLLYGFQYNKMLTSSSDDCSLLVRYIHALGDLALLSKSALVAGRIVGESLRFCCLLRLHREAKVRMEVLRLVAVCVEMCPKRDLLVEHQESLLELRLWMTDLLGPIKGEPNTQCRTFANIVGAAIDAVFKIH
nr:unnamed protein product [Callosobruchus analis]